MNWIQKFPNKFVNTKKINGTYRIFKNLKNIQPPYSIYKNKSIINWSNNDYNGLSRNKKIKKALIDGIYKYGCGSSGTRNIGGSSLIHSKLETKISELHNKQESLLFGSGYLANLSSMQAFGNIFPSVEFFSDEYNHNSLINGMKLCSNKRHIYKHNDLNNLEYLLKKRDNFTKQKIIVCESMYSTDGSLAELNDIIYLKKKYNCLLFVDEIHAVGVHGKKGGGITDLLEITDDIDIIMGGFGKGYGLIGGYIAGEKSLIDSIRLCASGFIFTTSLPPHIVNANIESININMKYLKSYQIKRNKLIHKFKNLARIKKIPLIENKFKNSQIQSILIGDASKAEKIHNILLNEYNHYVQHLNYPTVAFSNERLRISLKYHHTNEMIIDLLNNIEILINRI